MLGITNPSRHRFVFDAFTDLFIEYPHHSTFRAISDLALDDVTADELVNAFTLKQIWSDSPLFSSFRTKRRDVLIASNKASLLGWTLAVRLVRKSRGFLRNNHRSGLVSRLANGPVWGSTLLALHRLYLRAHRLRGIRCARNSTDNPQLHSAAQRSRD